MQLWVVQPQHDGPYLAAGCALAGHLAAANLRERRWFVERLSYTPVGWCKPLTAGGLSNGDSHHLLVSARLASPRASSGLFSEQ